MKNMLSNICIIASICFSLAACSKQSKKNPKNVSSDAETGAGHGQAAEDGDAVEGGDAPKPEDNGRPLMLTCDPSSNKKYQGLGGKELTLGRVEEVPKLGDRARIKPFSALTGEFSRVLKFTPSSLTNNAATFNAAPDRWYLEPSLNGVNVFTAYRAAYEAALSYAGTDPMLLAAPSDESATQACAAIAEKAWNRQPTEQEVNSCKKVALNDSASEGDIKKRWAYAIASILTATGFMSY
jgi:hypothetical protein